jgi:hypothetical protein
MRLFEITIHHHQPAPHVAKDEMLTIGRKGERIHVFSRWVFTEL